MMGKWWDFMMDLMIVMDLMMEIHENNRPHKNLDHPTMDVFVVFFSTRWTKSPGDPES